MNFIKGNGRSRRKWSAGNGNIPNFPTRSSTLLYVHHDETRSTGFSSELREPNRAYSLYGIHLPKWYAAIYTIDQFSFYTAILIRSVQQNVRRICNRKQCRFNGSSARFQFSWQKLDMKLIEKRGTSLDPQVSYFSRIPKFVLGW